jgi:hypothetical protein
MQGDEGNAAVARQSQAGIKWDSAQKRHPKIARQSSPLPRPEEFTHRLTCPTIVAHHIFDQP